MKAPVPQTVTVPAIAGSQPGALNAASAGKYFYCQSASATFLLQFDGGAVTIVSPGMQLQGKFRRLTFFNNTSASNVITYFISDEPIESVSVTTAQMQNSLANCLVEAEGQFQVSSNAGGRGNNAKQFAAAGSYFRQATIVAQKGLDGTANVGTVYIGTTSASQPIALTAGQSWELDADSGGKRDFGSWWISADNLNDGISIQYV